MLTFKQKPLMVQVFYNMLIEPLREVQQCLRLQSSVDAKEKIMLRFIAMREKLGVNDWHPFPHYQLLREQLKLEEKVHGILVAFVTNSLPIDGEIESLISLAHLLNFIDILAKHDHLREGSIKISELFKLFSGYKEFLGVTNCQGQMSYSVNKKTENQNFPLPEQYLKAIRIINLLLNKGKLESVCGELFGSHPENGSEVSELVQVEIGALFQDNLFEQAAVKQFIEGVHSYKKDFANNMEETAVEEETALDFSPD